MFGLLGGGVRVAGQGLGKVFPGIRAKVPAERTAERTTEPPKPARGLPPEPTPVSEPPLPIIGGKPEGARQLGKSEAEAFPALPTEKLPAAQVEPQAAAPEPVRPTMPAAKAPSPIDPAVKHEALKADREHFQKQGLDRGEANRAAEQLAEGDFVGLSKEEGAKIRRQFDMDKLSPAEREARLRVVSEVKSAGTDSKAIDIADDVLANERAITRHEHAAMELKAAELVDVYDQEIAEAARLIDAGDDAAAALARGRADVVFDQVDRLTRAADTGGRELARDFGFRRTMIDKNTMDLARVMQRAKVAKGSRLTPQETSRIEEVISELKRVEAENVRLTAEHGKAQAALEKARAEGIVARIAKRKTIMEKAESSREGLRAQRDDIKKQIAALGFRLNDVTGVSAEAS